MKTEFIDVAHLYKGVLMKTNEGQFPLMMWHDGNWFLDTDIYGFSAVERNIKPIMNHLRDLTKEQAVELGKLLLTVEISTCHVFKNRELDQWVFCWVDNLGGRGHWVIDGIIFNQLQAVWLLKNHFDIFGFIEAGEAHDKSKLN